MCWRKRKIVPDITRHITQNPETPDDATTQTEESNKIEVNVEADKIHQSEAKDKNLFFALDAALNQILNQ